MGDLFGWYRAQHLAPLMLAASAMMLLAGAAMLWSPGPESDGDLASLRQMRGAYERVVPGRTSESDLARLGFDTSRYRAHVLSGPGGAGISRPDQFYRFRPDGCGGARLF